MTDSDPSITALEAQFEDALAEVSAEIMAEDRIRLAH